MSRKNLLKGFKRPKGLQFEPSKKDQTQFYGKFSAYPFERGFGVTIGNTLRRVLLSSIQGYAVSAIRITSFDASGNPHQISSEYEPIPGVVEDTVELLSSLKKLRFRVNPEQESVLVVVEVKDEPILLGKHFSKGNVEVVNDDEVLINLSKGAHIEIEAQIDLGRGYVPSEIHDKNTEVLNTITLDSIYSPVVKVKFDVENYRVGYRSDYEKLNMEIFTDGTISPEDALAEAAKIAKEHFSFFINFNEEDTVDDDEQSEDDVLYKHILSLPVTELELSVRSNNCLNQGKISTIGDLITMTEDELAKIRNFGKKSLEEIKMKLKERNLTFGMHDKNMIIQAFKSGLNKESDNE